MLQTVALEASFFKISGRILQNRDFQVGEICESILALESWDLWSVSGRSLGFLGGLWEVFQFKFLALESLKRVWEVSGDLWRFLGL